MMLRLFYYCLLLLVATGGSAQNISFNHLTVENGLSGNSVIAIAQDADGFMWYGTQNNGLNKYDGVSFTNYSSVAGNPNSLSGNTISSIFKTSDGKLWIGTSKGIHIYDKLRDRFDKISSRALTDSTIYCIYEDSDHHIWVGTKSGLYLVSNKKTYHFQLIIGPERAHPTGRSVRCIYEDSRKNLWVGTQNGLICIRDKNNPKQLQEYRHNHLPNSISGDYITTIIEDANRDLWVGTHDRGLNKYDVRAATFTHYPQLPGGLINNSIRKILADRNGNLWIGTQEGLSILQLRDKKFVSYTHHPEDGKSIGHNSVHNIFRDANDNIWIGTFFGGVSVAYAYNTRFEVYQHNSSVNSISNNVISSITEDEQYNLWIGTEGGGLNHYNRHTGLFTTYKNDPNNKTSLSSNLIKKVYRDRKQHIWIGTSYNKGLNMLDVQQKTFRLFTVPLRDESSYDEITAILEDGGAQIWVGSQSGLYTVEQNGEVYNPVLQPAPYVPVRGKDVRALYEDGAGNLWIGTSTGVYVLDKLRHTISLPFQGQPYADANVNCIFEDGEGVVWIATRNMGLIRWTASNRTVRGFTTSNGLPDNNVWGIVEDEAHNLWLSTENGIAKFIKSSQSFLHYNTYDGLPSNKFNVNSYYRDHSGRIFFGSYNGLVSFLPGNIETNHFISPLQLTSLRLFNKPVTAGDDTELLSTTLATSKAISFNSNQNVFSIDFALLNYIKPHKNTYAYMLDGFDKQWNYTASTSATYTNLPPGKYRFLVKASNNDNIWSQPISMTVQIDPPIWRTWWAYLLYIFIALAGVFFVTRFLYLKALFKKEYELQQLKLNFFTNISHEIRTHLTLIKAPVEKLSFINKDNSKASEMLKYIKTNASRLLELVTELMDFRKAETNNLPLHVSKEDIIFFLADIISSFQETATHKNIDLSFVRKEGMAVYFDKNQMSKVFVNLLSNAFKFTPEGGSITVSVHELPQEVHVEVTDNGKGIAADDIKKVFTNYYQAEDDSTTHAGYGIGLALSKAITELHKGELTAESQPASQHSEGYTRFTVRLQKGSAHFSKGQLVSPGQEVKSLPEADEELPGDVHKKPTVLTVEDNQEVRHFIVDALEDAYTVLETGNGKTGLEIAFEQLPDIIISDIMMPEMDGLAFCKMLKTDERTSHIPVILLTAKSGHDQQLEGLEHGADLYVTKPFSLQLLELQVRNLLTARMAMRQKYSRQIVLEPKDIVINNTDEQFLKKLLALIEDHINDPELGVLMLTEKVGMSKPVLYKKLKALTDMSVHDFIISIRMKKAVQLLQQKQLTITEIAYAVGYSDRKYFSKEFKRMLGKSPTEFMGETSEERAE